MKERFSRLRVLFGDAAYARTGLRDWVKETCGWILQTILRPVAVKGFVVLPKRWMVERPFAWIGRCRRHSKDYERNPQTSETMIQISMIALMPRRLEKPKTKFEDYLLKAESSMRGAQRAHSCQICASNGEQSSASSKARVSQSRTNLSRR